MRLKASTQVLNCVAREKTLSRICAFVGPGASPSNLSVVALELIAGRGSFAAKQALIGGVGVRTWSSERMI